MFDQIIFETAYFTSNLEFMLDIISQNFLYEYGSLHNQNKISVLQKNICIFHKAYRMLLRVILAWTVTVSCWFFYQKYKFLGIYLGKKKFWTHF